MTDQVYCPIVACYGTPEVWVVIDGVGRWVCALCAKKMAITGAQADTPKTFKADEYVRWLRELQANDTDPDIDPVPCEGDERQTYTATVGITIYAKSFEEAEAVLDTMSMHDDCKYLNVHDIEEDEGEV